MTHHPEHRPAARADMAAARSETAAEVAQDLLAFRTDTRREFAAEALRIWSTGDIMQMHRFLKGLAEGEVRDG